MPLKVVLLNTVFTFNAINIKWSFIILKEKVFKNLIGHNSVMSLNMGNEENTSKNKIGLKALPKLVEMI